MYGVGTQLRWSARHDDEPLRRRLLALKSEAIASTIVAGVSQFEERLIPPQGSNGPPPPKAPCSPADPTKPNGSDCDDAELLVVNDARAAFWKQYCSWIHARVESGMKLIVAGAPPNLKECEWLPVFAKEATETQNGTWFDRRPNVTFLFDPSRLGHLRFQPTLVPVSQPTAIGEDGMDAQIAVVRAVLADTDSGAWRFDADTGTFTTGDRQAAIALKHHSFRTFERADTGRKWTDYRVEVDKENGGASTMLSESWIDQRIEHWIKQVPFTGRYGIEDTFVVFAYNVGQPGHTIQAGVADIVARGGHVIVIPIKTPYDGSFSGRLSLASFRDELAKHEPGPFADGNANLENRIAIYDHPISLAGSAKSDEENAAKWLLGKLRERELGGRMRMQVEHLGRFVDERMLEEDGKRLARLPAISHSGAPLRFQQLAVRPARAVTTLLTMRDDEARATKPPTELDPIPLGYGTVIGQGHVLMLGYSLFEGVDGLDDLTFTAGWEDDPAARLNVAKRDDRWGARRILDLAWLTSRLEPRPSETPRVVVMAVTSEGSLAITVRERIDTRGATFRGLYLRPSESDTDERCVHDAASADLGLRQLHPAESKIVFELTPSAWQTACPRGSCLMLLCQTCAGTDCHAEHHNRIFLGPAPRHVANVLDELAALDQIRLVAAHTGGAMNGPVRPLERSARPLMVLLTSGLLGLVWIRRLARRLPRLRRQRLAAKREASFENARGYLREVGEALGTPSTDVAAGAFAGLRPIDPGDKLRAALREDVVVMSGVAGDIEGPLRVIQRIDERTRRLAIVVNIGSSMRRPGGWHAAPEKLQLAAFAADVIAEVAWAARGEVRVVLLDGIGDPTVHQVTPGAPPSEVVLKSRKRHDWVRRLDTSEVDPGEGIIFISDYLNEPADELVRAIDELEGEGNAVGFVRIVAPAEWRLMDFGVHRGRMLDRTDWSEEELMRAYAELGAGLERDLDGSTGGIVDISHLDAPSALATITNSRLMALLR